MKVIIVEREEDNEAGAARPIRPVRPWPDHFSRWSGRIYIWPDHCLIESIEKCRVSTQNIDFRMQKRAKHTSQMALVSFCVPRNHKRREVYKF